jgi:hypothetical protein
VAPTQTWCCSSAAGLLTPHPLCPPPLSKQASSGGVRHHGPSHRVDAMLECEVCNEFFTGVECPRPPKVLPCDHIFCLECIARLPASQQPNHRCVTCLLTCNTASRGLRGQCWLSNRCPLDNREVVIVEPSILPDSGFILALLAHRQQGQQPQPPQGGAGLPQGLPRCVEHPHQALEGYCRSQGCQRLVCPSCAMFKHRTGDHE